MNNTLDHKCPNCDAVLKFNVENQNFKCEYCRSEYNIDDLNNPKLSKDTSDKEFDIYVCNNCGAKIIADSNTSATSCIYCKNTAIFKNKLEGNFNPDYLIPFKITQNQALSILKKYFKGKFLMPTSFNNKKNIKEIKGIYVPFWIYDYKTVGVIETDCEKTSKWNSGVYKYIKTDKYKVIRGGKITFENVPVDGSKNIQNDIMNSIEPYNYKELEKFNYSYLSGFLAEKYDLTKEESIKEANLRVKNSFIKEMKKDIIGYDKITDVDNSINLNNTKSSYVLLPIWFLNIKNKNKTYTFAINGQTGKVTGNIPIDIKKTIFIWLSLFIVIFFIILLLNYMGGIL